MGPKQLVTAAVVVLAAAALATWMKPGDLLQLLPGSPAPQCVGTAERPARIITVDPSLPARGANAFCLRLPRFVKNPPSDVTGKKQFVRHFNNTCGLYSIVFSGKVPAGGGPVPHVHFADEEFFLPGTPGDVVRVHAEKAAAGGPTAKASKASKGYTEYKPGQVPGFNMPPVEVGGVEVAYGSVGYAPVGTAHTWKAVTDLTNFMAIWLVGWATEAGVNIPESEPDADRVLEQTGLWGVPTDSTQARMFAGGTSWMQSARGPIALPPVTRQTLARLQDLFDRGEACCTDC